MDKKLLLMFRTFLNLDEKTLPDSISPEDFSKLFEKSSGKFKKDEDFKKLQKTLSQKDLDLKKIEEDFEKIKKTNDDKKSDSEKKIENLSKTVEDLTKNIEVMNTAHQSEVLQKTYPDILPEFLIGKSNDEIEKIVDKQREVNKKMYGDSQHFAPPSFSTEADFDEAIDKVKEDKTKNGESSAVDILKLNRQKENLPV